jgi:hypothetical protein
MAAGTAAGVFIFVAALWAFDNLWTVKEHPIPNAVFQRVMAHQGIQNPVKGEYDRFAADDDFPFNVETRWYGLARRHNVVYGKLL